MNKESRNFYEEQEIFDALQRYEEMLRKGAHLYFDVFQLEYIIDNFLEDGKIFPALQAVEMGMNQHPSSIALKIKKASILLNLGEVTNSLELTNQLLQIEDTNHELYLLKGSSHLLLGETNEAINSFNLSLKYSIEDRDETLSNIGYSYEQIGDYKKAITYFEEAISLEPDNDETLYELAFCYEKIGENEKSIALYDKYLDLETYSDSAWFNLGILYTKIENFEKSVWAYEMALAINEDFPNAWFNLGHSHMMMNNYNQAIDAFMFFIAYDSENDDIYCFIADCYLNLKKENKALKYYHKSAKINPLNANAWYGIGLIEKYNLNDKKAFDSLKKALKIDDENCLYHYTFALVAANLKRYRDAVSSFDAAIEMNPLELDYWLSYSEMQYKRGMVVSAIETLKMAAQYHEDNSLINYRLAAYFLESQNEKDAALHLEKALEANYENHHYFYDSFPEAINFESMVNLIKKHKTIDL